jgi:hypothetical protein
MFVSYSSLATTQRYIEVSPHLRRNAVELRLPVSRLVTNKIDRDTYKGHEVTSSRNIPRRSTLLVLRGDEEISRIIAGTDPKEIEALMAKGL